MEHTPQPGLAGVLRPQPSATEHSALQIGRVVAVHPETDTIDAELLQGGRVANVPVLRDFAGRNVGAAELPPVTPGYGTATATGQADTYVVIGYLNGRSLLPVALGFFGPKDAALLRRPAGSSIRRDAGGQVLLAGPDGGFDVLVPGGRLRFAPNDTAPTLDPALMPPASAESARFVLETDSGAGLTIASDGAINWDAPAGFTINGSSIGGGALSDLPPLTLGPVALSGDDMAASRADHVHPYPTAANVGAIPLTALTNTAPASLASVAAAGISADVARLDHVHPYPTAANVGALPVAGGTLTGDLNIGGGYLSIIGKAALRGTDAWLRLNQNAAGASDFANGTYVNGVLRAGNLETQGLFRFYTGTVHRTLLCDNNDGWLRIGQHSDYASQYTEGVHTPFRFLSATTYIGTHPTHGNVYAALWLAGYTGVGDYALMADASHTYINSRNGAIYLRNANGNRATLDNDGLTLAGRLIAPASSSIGSGAVNCDPTSSDWSTGKSSLMLNGSLSASLTFHQSGYRADTIVCSGGIMYLGKDLGFGRPQIRALGNFVGTGANNAFNSSGPTANVRLSVSVDVENGSQFPLVVTNSAASTWLFYLQTLSSTQINGYLRAASWSYNSDERQKEEIEDEIDGLANLRKVRPISFHYLGADKKRGKNRGFSAQQLQTVFPELVDVGRNGMLTVRTTELIPVLCKALQELDTELETLKRRLRRIEGKAA